MTIKRRATRTIRAVLVRFALLVYLPAVLAVAAVLALETRTSIELRREELLLRAELLAAAATQTLDVPKSRNWETPVVGREVLESASAVPTRRLQDLIEQATPKGWYGEIVDGSGTVIARKPHPEQYVGSPAPAAIIKAIGHGARGVTELLTAEGVSQVVGYQTIKATADTVVVGVPKATIFQPAWRRATALSMAALLLLLFALAVTSRLQRALVRSIAAVVEQRPKNGKDPPLAFVEAEELRCRLRQEAHRLEVAHAEVDEMHRDFQRRLVAKMDERLAQLGADLHDHVGSTLAGLSMVLARLRRDAPAGLAPTLEKACSIAERGSDDVRRIARGLVPVGLAPGGLPQALEQLATDLHELHGVSCRVTLGGDFSAMPRDVAGHLYRIAQEAASNAIRHGKAKQLWFSLVRTGSRARLCVEDAGQGMPMSMPNDETVGIGLRTMRARAGAIGADIRFERSAQGGLTIVVRCRGPWLNTEP